MNRTKLWRIERGLSQHELAVASGVPRHVIQLCESGICLPTERNQKALAKTLGVKLSELFTCIKPDTVNMEKSVGRRV